MCKPGWTRSLPNQSQLEVAGRPYDGVAYLQFTSWDGLENGNKLGFEFWAGVEVANGLFTVEVDTRQSGSDFFTGNARGLQIVLTDTGGGNAIVLSPRQAITRRVSRQVNAAWIRFRESGKDEVVPHGVACAYTGGSRGRQQTSLQGCLILARSQNRADIPGERPAFERRTGCRY